MARTRRTPEKRDWKPVFLQALRDTGIVRSACELANMPRQTVYDHRGRDQQFATEWDQALLEGSEALEQEARRRAVDGVTRTRYAPDGTPYQEQVYSDTLLIFLLKGANPQKYGSRATTEVSVKVTQQLDLEVRRKINADPATARAAAEFLGRLSASPGPAERTGLVRERGKVAERGPSETPRPEAA